MRTGSYDPGAASLFDVAVDVDGVSNDPEAVAAVSGKLQESSGKDFAEAVARAIKEYRQREAGWNKPNTCASLRFAPGSQTLHLETGQSGRITGHVEANRGGISMGHWSLVGQQNATYSPTTAVGTAPVFGYHVTRAGRNVTVSATFHVTSKAGVAEGSWRQGTKAAPPYPRRFVGSATWDSNVQYVGPGQSGQDHANVEIEVTFVRSTKSRSTYVVDHGTAQWAESGRSADCSWQGSGSKPLEKSAGGLMLAWDERERAFRANFFADEGVGPFPLSTCSGVVDQGAENPLFPLSRVVEGFRVDPDGLTLSGSDSYSDSSPEANVSDTWTWDFRGIR
jgi:hypothetical protein